MFATPHPPQAPPLVRLAGMIPYNVPSLPRADGTRLLMVAGCYPRSDRVRVLLDHRRQLTTGVVAGRYDGLVLRVELDPLRPDHRPVLDSLRAGDYWGMSGLLNFRGDWHISRYGGGDIHEVFWLDEIREMTLTRLPLFDCSRLKMEN